MTVCYACTVWYPRTEWYDSTFSQYLVVLQDSVVRYCNRQLYTIYALMNLAYKRRKWSDFESRRIYKARRMIL